MILLRNNKKIHKGKNNNQKNKKIHNKVYFKL